MLGEIALGGVRVFLEITPRYSRVATRINELKISISDLNSFDSYLFQGMDTLYIVNFISGQIAYFEGSYDRALFAFSQAVGKIPSQHVTELKVDALYSYRGNTYFR